MVCLFTSYTILREEDASYFGCLQSVSYCHSYPKNCRTRIIVGYRQDLRMRLTEHAVLTGMFMGA